MQIAIVGQSGGGGHHQLTQHISCDHIFPVTLEFRLVWTRQWRAYTQIWDQIENSLYFTLHPLIVGVLPNKQPSANSRRSLTE